MRVDLYTASVPVFRRGLDGLSRILDKAEAHARATGASEAELLNARLVPDMWPLYRQVQKVCDFANQAPSRLLGRPLPPELTGEPGLAELRQHIAQAKAFLESLSPAEFVGRDAQEVSIGHDVTLPAGQYLLGLATGNFYFHLVTAYGVARMFGVDLSKQDYFAGGL